MLIKCPECQNDVSDAATSCPKCGHPLTPKKMAPRPAPGPPELSEMIRSKGAVGCGVVIVAALLLVSLAIVGGSNPDHLPASNTATSPGSTSPAGPVTDNAVTSEPPPVPASPWVYSDDVDPMTSNVTKFACTTSTNEAVLSFPYHNVTARLCIRKSPRHGLEAFVQLDGDGQMMCGVEGCSLPIRFDSAKPHSFPAVEASDNSSNILFINRTASLVAGLKKSSTTIVEVSFFQNGSQALAFPTSKLNWP